MCVWIRQCDTIFLVSWYFKPSQPQRITFVTQTRAYNDSRQREIRPGEIRQSELRPSENKQSENRLNETPPLLLYPNQFLLVSKSPQCHYTAFTSDWRLLTLSLFRASNWP